MPHSPAHAVHFDAAAAQPPLSPWVRYCRFALVLTAAGYGVIGICAIPLALFLAESDSGPPWFGGLFGALAFVVSVGFGIVNWLAARGLAERKRWGWILAVILGGIYAPSACLPIGALLLFGLLQKEVRDTYL